jgi:hypothetical protein
MDQAELLRYLLDVVEQQELPYAIAGSHASMAFGEYRFTMDIDIVIGLTSATLRSFCDAFPTKDFYVSEDGARAAVLRGGMFNIIHPESGQKIDVIVPSSEFDRGQLTRAVVAPVFPGRDGRYVAPEDQIIKKMEYYREGGSEKHLRDITGILKVMGERIDRHVITQWASQMDLMPVWEAIIHRIDTNRSQGR